MRLKATNICLAFGERTVLSGVDLEIESGESLAIMGPSGSGKSTLLALLAGEQKPDTGTLSLISGREREDIAWILQSTPLLPRREAFENVRLGPLSVGFSDKEAARRARGAMSDLGVAHTEGHRVFKLSGGERQRLAVARAIAAGSGIVLADEPTASLDPVSRDAVVASLKIAAECGAIVIVATHDPIVAAGCDRVVSITETRLWSHPKGLR